MKRKEFLASNFPLAFRWDREDVLGSDRKEKMHTLIKNTVRNWLAVLLFAAVIIGIFLAGARASAEAPRATTGGLSAVASADGAVVYRMTRDGVVCFVATRGGGTVGSSSTHAVAISCVPAGAASGAWAP